uniref:Uncharacterized protein n=1 Tax=Amphimedon queenslandica TaxID=400682 RepID=A0A1X7USK9_AMPQE
MTLHLGGNEVSGFSVDDFVIDIYYWFDKSTKRKAAMAEYCTFCDVTYRDMIKHVNTIIREANGDFIKIQYDKKEDQLSDEFIFIGITTRMTLRKLIDEGDCSSYDAYDEKKFLLLYNDLLTFKSPKKLDALLEEFINYKLLVSDNIPSSVWEEALVSSDESDVTHHRADVIALPVYT